MLPPGILFAVVTGEDSNIFTIYESLNKDDALSLKKYKEEDSNFIRMVIARFIKNSNIEWKKLVLEVLIFNCMCLYDGYAFFMSEISKFLNIKTSLDC